MRKEKEMTTQDILQLITIYDKITELSEDLTGTAAVIAGETIDALVDGFKRGLKAM